MPAKFELPLKKVASELLDISTGAKGFRAVKGLVTSDMKNENFKEFLFLTELLSSAIHINGDVSDQQQEELNSVIEGWKKKSKLRSKMSDEQSQQLKSVLEQGYIPFEEIVSAFNANSSAFDDKKTQELRLDLNKIINSNNRQDTAESIFLFRVNLLLQGYPKLPLYYVHDDKPLDGHAADLVTQIPHGQVTKLFPATSGDIPVNELATTSPGNEQCLITLEELTSTDIVESFESELVEALRLGGAKRVVIRTMHSSQEEKSVQRKSKTAGRKGFLSFKADGDVKETSSDTSSREEEREYKFEGARKSFKKLLFGEGDQLSTFVERSRWLKNDPEIRNMVLSRCSSRSDNALTSYQYSGTINKTAKLALDVDIALSASKGKILSVDLNTETHTQLEAQTRTKREIEAEF